ncbi:sialate O-acetylesterase [Fulvivirga ligni]|uniref:sialate O-acetylesterase n=1 Tax=Fulvivirga ligni TaxID=2904246 RepID=UPI001F43A36F|nr:sialate O-acetylesterase [Fulvivirga ligni]UII19543.1 sialate O-acetylesterase [Fulvivirga ligni]
MKKLLLINLLLAFAVISYGQDLSFADPLGEHMVIQQNKPFKVWGTAKSGTSVEISADWLSSSVTVKADEDGQFIGIITVPAIKKGDFKNHWLSIGSEGQTKKLEDVLIGDVWICSGQSNMQFGLHEVPNAREELAKASHPQVRLFSAGLNFSNDPLMNISGEWKVCDSVSAKKFSAVAYFFGTELQKDLNIPVGIVFTGIGASAAQAYVPREVLAADPVLNKAYLQPYLESDKSKEKIDGGFSFEKVTRPFLLYNAVIHPFKNLSISGFCWYQGESNRDDRSQYTQLMYKMISSWRDAFQQGELPFYFVQVAPYYYDIEDPTMADYAFFREAQEAITDMGNTEMVITMDVGEAKDLHPKNKKPIGVRLEKTALNRYYGQLNVAYQGPHFESAEFNKSQAIVTFQPGTVTGGLKTNDGAAPKFFEVAGEDQVFHPAHAQISGNQIIVSSKEVKKPVAVRYAFTNYPVTNLENGAGFPAVPFRSDNWPEPPVKKK